MGSILSNAKPLRRNTFSVAGSGPVSIVIGTPAASARWLDPHARWTATDGTSSGSQAASHAHRPTGPACSPT